VDAEDMLNRKIRIADYQQEIDEALKKVEAAKREGKAGCTLSFDVGSNGFAQANRVREALGKMGYICSKVESRQGDWINGVGYHRYLAFYAQF